MKLKKHILRALYKSWSGESSSQWNEWNPAKGQCSVTALVIQDIFGGEIMKTSVGNAWHYYNFIEGERIDFTASQFALEGRIIRYDDYPSSREDAFTDTDDEQYTALYSKFILAFELEIGLDEPYKMDMESISLN